MTMEAAAIRIHIGCDEVRNFFTIKMKSDKVDFWNEYLLLRQTIDPENITGITVGPRTVLQVFSDPYFYRLRRTIKNPSYKQSVHINIGCFKEQQIWRGIVRSFKIWNYHYYDSLFGMRFCQKDSDCYNTEYCLCPGGQRKGEWCPITKKRCLHKSKYLHNKDKEIYPDDLVDMNCLMYHVKQYNKPYVNFRDVKRFCEKCSGSDVLDNTMFYFG